MFIRSSAHASAVAVAVAEAPASLLIDVLAKLITWLEKWPTIIRTQKLCSFFLRAAINWFFILFIYFFLENPKQSTWRRQRERERDRNNDNNNVRCCQHNDYYNVIIAVIVVTVVAVVKAGVGRDYALNKSSEPLCEMCSANTPLYLKFSVEIYCK